MQLKKSISHLALRIIGFTLGLTFISTSIFYSSMMPIIELPKPSGGYTVGSTKYVVIDEFRNEILSEDPNDKRELFVEVWYPGNLEAFNGPKEINSLWHELYSGDKDIVSFFTNYLKGVETSSYLDIPGYSGDGLFPVILFNHGLQMFTSQSTLLMEHLASHGYIVVSISHPYESLKVNLTDKRTVLPEFITSFEKFNEAMNWIKENSAPIIAAKDSIKGITSKENRSRIILNAIKNSDMNILVSEWEKDTHFILGDLLESEEHNLPFLQIMDTSRIGIMGMSIGGAVATEYAKSNGKIKAAMNIDGIQYGKRNSESLRFPFMMIYSEDEKGTNDFLSLNSKSNYHEITFLNTLHANFTDMSLIWPIMKVYGQLGSISGKRMITLQNEAILNFWDAYLKDKPFKEFSHSAYPELKIINDLKN